jgi:hypothetical protein
LRELSESGPPIFVTLLFEREDIFELQPAMLAGHAARDAILVQ